VPNFWWRPFTALGLLIFFGLACWALFGATAALAALCAALLLHLLHHWRHIATLNDWLENVDSAEIPRGTGVWDDVFYGLQKLMRRTRHSQSKLSAVLERFQHAAQAIPDGIVMLNEADQIEWCNPVASRHFGLDIERDRGQFIKYLIRQEPFTNYLAAQSYAEPLVFKSPANREMTLSLQLVPFGDGRKLLMSRDVTELERVDTVRRDFVANVSHELRTPLTVVSGFLETFADMDQINPAEGRRYFQLMLEQTRRMERLVEDLLTLSRLESAQNGLPEERIDVPMLLQAIAGDARSLSNGKHDIAVALDAQDGLLGSGDELRSAFGNLVSNAVRYTPPGGKITLRWERKGEEACFSVTDTGEGIEAHHLPRLTERFYRVDHSRSRETGGTGLGLAIVKHVTTRHQARLHIASEAGKGSCFSICFPAHRLLELRPASTGTKAPTSTRAGPAEK
jgi:two-component system phosphate regulon sensor histidine kinase PhoR